jgi:hypothetical protein
MHEAEYRRVYVKISCSIICIIKHALDFIIYDIHFFSCDLKVMNTMQKTIIISNWLQMAITMLTTLKEVITV